MKQFLIIVFVILIGFGLYYSNQKDKSVNNTTPSSTPSPSVGVVTPDQVANAFFNWYLKCLDNHFKNPKGSPDQDCPFELSPYVNGKLPDDILCSSNTPASIKSDPAIINSDQASVVVHTYYYSSGDNPLIVELGKTNGQWKITNIKCTQS